MVLSRSGRWITTFIEFVFIKHTPVPEFLLSFIGLLVFLKGAGAKKSEVTSMQQGFVITYEPTSKEIFSFLFTVKYLERKHIYIIL